MSPPYNKEPIDVRHEFAIVFWPTSSRIARAAVRLASGYPSRPALRSATCLLEVVLAAFCVALTIALAGLLRIVAGYVGSELDWWDGLFLVVWPLCFLSLLLPDERSHDRQEAEEDSDIAVIRSRGRADAEAGLPPCANRYLTTSEQLAYRRGLLEHRRVLANLQGEADAVAGRPAREHNFQTFGEQCAYMQAYEKSRRKRRP